MRYSQFLHKSFFLVGLFLLQIGYSINETRAQSNDILAKSEYLNAETDYDLGKYSESLTRLYKVEQILGETNPRILMLMVKNLYHLEQWVACEQRIEEYFELAHKSDPFYNELLVMYGQIKGVAEKEKLRDRFWVVEPKMDVMNLAPFSSENNLWTIKNHDKWAVINTSGSIICEFDSIKAVLNGRARVLQKGLWGFIDEQGKIIIPCKFRNVTPFNEGVAAGIGTNHDLIWIDDDGNKISGVSGHYDWVKQLGRENYLVKKSNDKWMIFDNNFQKLFSHNYPIYSNGGPELFPSDWSQQKFIYVSSSGEKYNKNIYDWASNFKDGFAVVRKESSYFIIDKYFNRIYETSQRISPSVHSEVYYIHSDDHIGAINEIGNQIIAINYDWLNYDPDHRIFLAKKDNKYGVLDIHERVIINFEYENLSFLFTYNDNNSQFIQNTILRAKVNGLWGLIDLEGNTKVPFVFENIGYCSSTSFALAAHDGLWGIIQIDNR